MEKEIRTVGYKVVFSTDLSHDEIEDAIDSFLKEVDARQMMAHAEEMSPQEINIICNS